MGTGVKSSLNEKIALISLLLAGKSAFDEEHNTTNCVIARSLANNISKIIIQCFKYHNELSNVSRWNFD